MPHFSFEPNQPQAPKTQRMNDTDKKHLLKWNTILWLAAMGLPAILNIAFATAKFPWPMILPLLLLGPMLASNRMLSRAMSESTDAPPPNSTNA